MSLTCSHNVNAVSLTDCFPETSMPQLKESKDLQWKKEENQAYSTLQSFHEMGTSLIQSSLTFYPGGAKKSIQNEDEILKWSD
jgi:hypothetical protein